MVQINEIGAIQNVSNIGKSSASEKPQEASTSIFLGDTKTEPAIISE